MSLKDIGRGIKFFEEGHRRAPNNKEFVDALAALTARIGNMSDSMYYAKLSLVTDTDPDLSKYAPFEFEELERNLEHAGVSTYFVDATISYHERNYLECVGVFGLEVDFSNLLRREGVLRGRAKHDVVSWPDTEEVPEAEVANQSPQAMSVEAIGQRAFKPEPRSQSPGPTSHESRSQNPESTSQRSLCQADFGRTEDQVEKKACSRTAWTFFLVLC